MRNYIGYIIDYCDGNLTDRKRKWFESELIHNKELRSNYKLYKQVYDTMRGRYDIVEVLSDPELNSMNTLANSMVSDFRKNPDRFRFTKVFVENSLRGEEVDAKLQKELNKTADEANKHNLNEITAGWVDDWYTKNQKGDPETNSRKAFISSSLSDNIQVDNTPKVKRINTLAIRMVGLAAAALIAIFLVIKTLSPSSNPENLYQEFYKPLKASTATTRNSANIVDPFSAAVEKYKQGQYQLAGTMFSDLIFEDPNNIAFRFFSGITQLEIGDYNQSIVLLNEVVANNSDYKKEAQWYLALVYLKTDELQKATTIIDELSQTKGYFQAQAQELLKRLK